MLGAPSSVTRCTCGFGHGPDKLVVEFVKPSATGSRSVAKANTKCPCGSGRTVQRCHGKFLRWRGN